MSPPTRLPAWLVDLLLALLLVGLGVGVERLSQGRLANESIALWVGGGSFLLLRLGAKLAQAGRTLGCLFAFAITWLLPCLAVLYLASSNEAARIVRDSTTFFLMLGVFLIMIMVVTLERLRRADAQRHG